MFRHDYVISFSIWDEASKIRLSEKSFDVRTDSNVIASLAINHFRFNLKREEGIGVFTKDIYHDDHDQKCLEIHLCCVEKWQDKINEIEALLSSFLKTLSGFEQLLKEMTFLEFFNYLHDNFEGSELLETFTIGSDIPIELFNSSILTLKPLKDFNVATITEEGISFLREVVKDKKDLMLSTLEVSVNMLKLELDDGITYQYFFRVALQAPEEILLMLQAFYSEYFYSFSTIVNKG